MKLNVALCFAGVFGAWAAVFILLAFGTDYWLLASESCFKEPEGFTGTDSMGIKFGVEMEQNERGNVISYHEGLFWKCYFGLGMEIYNETWVKRFDKPPKKFCFPAYLYPFPVTPAAYNATVDEPAIIYRGFWSVFLLISVATIALGGFFIICAAPFANHCLYKAGGGLFLTSGFFLLCVIVMHVVWLQALDVVQAYIKQERASHCPDFQLSLDYGLSFIFAPIGVFFCILAGLLFLAIGRTVQIHHH